MASVETKGFLELTDEITKMADAFVGEGLDKIIKAGAEPILAQAKINAPVKSGTLRDDLKIAMKNKNGVIKARIGVQKGSKAFYATYVEYGHKGPHPAEPHPYLAPAFDAKKDEAYRIIKNLLEDQLK